MTIEDIAERSDVWRDSIEHILKNVKAIVGAIIAARIGELEDTVNRVEQDMGELQIETDPAIIARLDNIERSISAFDGDELADRIEDLEEIAAEVEELLWDGEIRWQIDDLFWRTDGLINILRDREWGRDAIQEWFGPGW